MNLFYSTFAFLLLGLFGATVSTPIKESDAVKTCAACQLVSQWQQAVGNRSAQKCADQCRKFEACEAVETLKPTSTKIQKTPFAHLLQERMLALSTTCQKKDLATILLIKQTDITDMTCLECFLFKDVLKFLNQNFFGGWLEETILKFLQSIESQLGLPFTNFDIFVQILFEALRESEGAIWTDLAVKSLGCPVDFTELNKQCCTTNCPPP